MTFSPHTPSRPTPPAPDHATVVARLRAAGCVFAEEEARILLAEAPNPAELAAMVERRADGLPLEHVVGWADFCGHRIAVDLGVFVPRRRTEFLAQQASALIRRLARGSAKADSDPSSDTVVVDLCCGSGAVGVVLAAGPDPITLYAADLDPAAVRCARRNLRATGGGSAGGEGGAVDRVYQGDLYEPLPAHLRGRVAVLVANTPYVPTEEMGLLPPEARVHEPRVALDGGADGLDVQRRVAAGAARWLAPGGHLLVETGERQTALTVDVFSRGGLTTRVAVSDELDATVVIGTRPGTTTD